MLFCSSQYGSGCYGQWVAPGSLYSTSGGDGGLIGNGYTITLPVAGTMSNLIIQGDVETSGSGETFVVYKNNATTALTVTAGEGSKLAINSGASVTCAAGDVISILYKAPSQGAWTVINISFVFTPS